MNGTHRGNRDDDERRRQAVALRDLAQRPGDAAAYQEALRAFGSERALVLAVHHRWQVHLLARLDQVLEIGPEDVHAAVLRTVDGLGRALPGFAAVLRDHADDPALAAADRRLAGYVALACPCGRPHRLVPRAAARQRSGCLVARARARAARCRCRLVHGPRLRALRA